MAQRHKDALAINEGAVNPLAISRSLNEAFREVAAETQSTKAQYDDAACRLILHQLAHLLGMTGGYDLTDYRRYVEECERKAKGQ